MKNQQTIERTPEDIEKAKAFFATPTGKSLLKAQPNTARHSPYVGPPEPSVFSHELSKAITERDEARNNADKLAEALREVLPSVIGPKAHVKARQALADYDRSAQ